MSFQIGTLAIPLIAGFDIQQRYQSIGPESIRRSISGRAIKQQTYNKLRIITSATGWVPAGLETIDVASVQTVRCVVMRSVPAVFATRQAILPAARRSDPGFTPVGYAFLPGGQAISSSVGLSGNIATVATVAGAVAYSVGYFPQVDCYITRPVVSGDMASATWSWELTAEEV